MALLLKSSKDIGETMLRCRAVIDCVTAKGLWSTRPGYGPLTSYETDSQRGGLLGDPIDEGKERNSVKAEDYGSKDFAHFEEHVLRNSNKKL